jgi:DNA topoisomerase-6 subunit B
VAADVCKTAKVDPRLSPRELIGPQAEALYRAIQHTKFMNPQTDCLSPIGEEAILAGLVKQVRADFYTASTRPPKVYRGNPFIIECGLAFGSGNGPQSRPAPEAEEESGSAKKKKEAAEAAQGKAEGEDEDEEVELARVIRFANRVPLLYQQSACAMFKSVLGTNWRSYGVQQSRGAPPQGPMVIMIHMASVWVPFTSEAKEAIAEYDEILEEIKRAVQECGRKLGTWVRKRQYARDEFARRNTFQRYIEEVAEACKRIKDDPRTMKKSDKGFDAEELKKRLQKIAEEITGGEEVNALLNKKKEPEATQEHTVVRTEKGLEGAVPKMAAEAAQAVVAPVEPDLIPGAAAPVEEEAEKPASAKAQTGKAGKPAGKKKNEDDPELFETKVEKKKGKGKK